MFVAMLLLSIWYFLGQFVLSHPLSLSFSRYCSLGSQRRLRLQGVQDEQQRPLEQEEEAIPGIKGSDSFGYPIIQRPIDDWIASPVKTNKSPPAQQQQQQLPS